MSLNGTLGELENHPGGRFYGEISADALPGRCAHRAGELRVVRQANHGICHCGNIVFFNQQAGLPVQDDIRDACVSRGDYG